LPTPARAGTLSRYHAVPHPYRNELVELTVTEGSNWIEALVVGEDAKSVPVRHQPDPEPPRAFTARLSGP
jgi:hypothetical protein